MRYGDCRWVDIDGLDKDQVVVVCPTAALEQHGHHLPLLTDTYLVSAVAERVEAQLPDHVALTPTLWLGASDHHLDFPGTVTVPNSLYVEMIKNMIRCFVKAGFRRILFLNGHGGNVAPGTVATTEMANECDECDGTLIAFSSYWTIAEPVMKPEQHGMASASLSHACEYETSMMLSVRHELVHMDQAVAGAPVIDSPFFRSDRGGRVTVAGRFHRLTGTGAMGSPEAATQEKGESLLTATADEVAAFVREFLQWKPLEVLKPTN